MRLLVNCYSLTGRSHTPIYHMIFTRPEVGDAGVVAIVTVYRMAAEIYEASS